MNMPTTNTSQAVTLREIENGKRILKRAMERKVGVVIKLW